MLQQMHRRALPWFLLGVAIFLGSLLFTPARAAIFPPGDVTIYMLNAARMLQGQIIYKDFFEFTPPGTELVYFVLFRIFGPHAWIPNAMLLLLGLSLVWLSIAVSRRVMCGWAVFLPGLLFLTFSLYNWLDVSHHWYSVLAIMAATALIIEKRTPRRMAVVGVLCGLASFFTQARGMLALVGFASFLVWERRWKAERRPDFFRSEVYLAASFGLTVLATNAYFVWRAGLARFLEATIVFGVRYYSAYPLNTWSAYLSAPPLLPLRPWYALPFAAIYLSVHILVPGAYLLFWGAVHARVSPPAAASVGTIDAG
jgi:hypothetical protein